MSSQIEAAQNPTWPVLLSLSRIPVNKTDFSDIFVAEVLFQYVPEVLFRFTGIERKKLPFGLKVSELQHKTGAGCHGTKLSEHLFFRAG